MPNLLEIVENGSHYRINFTDSAAVTASALIKFRLNRKKASSTRKSVDQPSLLFGDKHDRGEKVTNDDPESDDVFVLGVKTAFGAARPSDDFYIWLIMLNTTWHAGGCRIF